MNPIAPVVFVVSLAAGSLAAQQQFVPRTPAAFATAVATVGAVGGFDGDGDDDAFVFGQFAGFAVTNHRLLRNDGGERFTDLTATHLPPLVSYWYEPRDAVAFDADGDGDLDLLTTFLAAHMLWQNDGSGRFTNAPPFVPPLALGFRRVVAEDLDGDGDFDLAGIPDWPNASVQVVVNQGGGAFVLGPGPAMFTAPVLSLAAADIDGDSDLDLLAAGLSGLRVWRNQGALAFVDVTSTWAVGVPTTQMASIAAADLDGDSDPDLVLGGMVGVADLVLRNTGGAFVVVATLPASIAAATRALLLDVDDDGDVDFVRGQSLAVGLAVNDGLGNLALAPFRVGLPLPAAVHSAFTLVSGDFDRDGDPDLLIGNYIGACGLVMNRHRELRPGQPAIGQPWLVEVWSQPGYATANHAVVLAIGLATLAQPAALGAFGELWLDLGAPHLLEFGLVPMGSGVETFSFAVPSAPALVGLRLHLQALVDPAPAPPRLTAYYEVVVQ